MKARGEHSPWHSWIVAIKFWPSLSVILAAIFPNPLATPLPLFGFGHEVRSQGVALSVPHDLVEVVVCFDGKRFEAALVHVSATDHVVVALPPCHVRDR